jgi:hypothetical protein
MKNSTGSRWTDRPNGLDKSQYDVPKWPDARIAWEFIRRNEKYQQACDEAHVDAHGGELDASPGDHGSKVPLKTLVDYPLDWEQAEKQIEFVSRKKIVALEDGKSGSSSGRRYATYKFDLLQLARNPRLLELRLEEMKADLSERLREYAKKIGKRSGTPRGKLIPIERSLRFLDMEEADMPVSKMKEVLYSSEDSSKNRNRMLHKDRARARELVQGRLTIFIVPELLNEAKKRAGGGKKTIESSEQSGEVPPIK